MAKRRNDDAARIESFGDLLLPADAPEPILSKPVRGALMEWLTEIWAEAELKMAGITPRRRAIFDGPPGVGKTTLAHHIAARLGMPMVAVRPERLIDSYIGQTARNIGALFDAAREGLVDGPFAGVPVMVFLDEFDAIGHQRGRADSSAGQERNNYINTLLQRMEQFEGYLVAATNYGQHIDTAIWRRFDIHVALELPGQFERERIAERYLEPYGLPPAALREFGQALEVASPHLIKMLCENVKRQLIIGPKLDHDMSKAAVFDRVLASCHPHPEVGKPRLWSHLAADRAVEVMPWPMPRATDLPALAACPPPADGAGDAGNVVQWPKRGDP